MRHRNLLILLTSLSFALHAQEAEETSLERYLEDQFYLGVTYNILLNLPDGASQSNLSYGLQAGFIRDIPLNPQGTFALGVGLGYGVNSYYSNLRAIEEGDGFRYEYLDDEDYRRNKIETHLIEVPVEFRWRTSTRESYKFWRIYGGFKFGYVVGSRSKLVTESFKDSFYNTDTENFRYGLMLNLGYNTFNIHFYYGLNPLFEDGVVDPNGQDLDMVPLHLGLIFYIL
ncbi:MAG: porin family protein [Robiginitalea sp.]|nr:porin family protein [Robiginitalea sp.]